ncbi:MAG TPA: glycosyltransferase family 4 protein [Xanthobacteraceae bacterium]|nr:glycosyltransferase family 4 protein [Xanthobacteraceae bacterium]
MRSPVGGLFRHVADLVRGQAARGHQVGIVADSITGGARADQTFAALAGDLALGVTRCSMSRHAGWSDIAAMRLVARRAAETAADVVHGHGAKGGAYARFTGGAAIRVYTPHGGSLHFGWNDPIGTAYLMLERTALRRTELALFESAFAERTFRAKIGEAARMRVVHNGVAAAEFASVAPDPRATDLVFVGELRHLKGVDVLIDAIAILRAGGRPVSATIVGDGPDADAFTARAAALPAVRFVAAMPGRQAFARGRMLVTPSRFESLPYVVLEAAAAGLPLLATAVGGIPEILGPQASRLVPPGDAAVLARAIAAALDDPAAERDAARTLQARVRAHFSVDTMTDQVIAGYRAAMGPHPAR